MNRINKQIPHSIIRGNVVNTDLETRNKGEKILFLDPRCVVIGINNVPEAIFFSWEFEMEQLPAYIKESIYEGENNSCKVYIHSQVENIYYAIPEWFVDFVKMECLSLDNAVLDNLDVLKGLPIKHIIFNDVRFEDKHRVVSALKQFKELTKIDCEEPFYSAFKNAFTDVNLEINQFKGVNVIVLIPVK